MKTCRLCGLIAEDVREMAIRVSLPMKDVIKPEYEHDYNVAVCADCRFRLNYACAMAELEEAACIRDEAAARMSRQKDRVAFLMEQERAEEEAAAALEKEKEV